MAVVRKILSPKTMGEEWPLPGMGAFRQCFRICSIAGDAGFTAVAVAGGPRHMGHSSAHRHRMHAQQQKQPHNIPHATVYTRREGFRNIPYAARPAL